MTESYYPGEYDYDGDDRDAPGAEDEPAGDWPCDAYGPDGLQFGARCFLSGELGGRVCPTQDSCREAMGGERQRIFDRLQELAAEGDPVWAGLASEFTSPDQIFRGE